MNKQLFALEAILSSVAARLCNLAKKASELTEEDVREAASRFRGAPRQCREAPSPPAREARTPPPAADPPAPPNACQDPSRFDPCALLVGTHGGNDARREQPILA